MAPSAAATDNSIIDAWTSVLLILGVATILGVNAVLLHATNRRANGRFVRPLLRIATGRPRARSASLTTELALAGAVENNSTGVTTMPPPATRADSEVWQAARTWVKWDPNDWTRAIVQGWIENGDLDSARRCVMMLFLLMMMTAAV